MSRYASCEEVYVGGTYFGESAALSISLLLECILLIHAVIHHFLIHNHEENKSPKHVILYILLIIIGICWLTSELVRWVIDPLLSFAPETVLCSVLSHFGRMIPYWFYSIYLIQILSRIQASFKDSYLAVSKCFIHCFTILITLEPLILSLLFIRIDTNNGNDSDHHSVCIQEWNAVDINNIEYCTLPYDSIGIIAVYLGLFVVVIQNIIFMVVFILKLRSLLMHSSDQQISFEFKALIIKCTILTISGVVSTMIALLSFAVMGISMLLSFDIVFNSLVISLMFQYNDKHYRFWCRPCIWICLMKCERNTDLNRQRSSLYLDGKKYNQTTKACGNSREMELCSVISASGRSPSTPETPEFEAVTPYQTTLQAFGNGNFPSTFDIDESAEIVQKP